MPAKPSAAPAAQAAEPKDNPAAAKPPAAMADRIAAGLEGHFLYCTQALKVCMERAERDYYQEIDVRKTVGFLRTSAQIGAVIARFEDLKIRGSIPQ